MTERENVNEAKREVKKKKKIIDEIDGNMHNTGGSQMYGRTAARMNEEHAAGKGKPTTF